MHLIPDLFGIIIIDISVDSRLMSPVIGVVAVILFILYVVLPLIFRYSSAFQKQLVFLPYTISFRWPIAVDYSRPELHGLSGARNFYLPTEPKISVGVWHILPRELASQSFKTDEESLSNGNPIVLYLHGNSGSRATGHRVELYKLLISLNYHVITIDYRGFADSSNVAMSENGAVTDATSVYQYIQKFSGKSKVLVWGHSLGTAVAIKMAAQLSTVKQSPDGLILESPFNNIRDVFRNHPLTILYRPLSVVDRFFTDRLQSNNVAFDSDVHIAGVECPTLILHARDDPIVPVFLTQKLYEAGLKSRPSKWSPLQIIEFHQDLKCAHEYICRVPQLPSIIKEFLAG